ncbi:MAG TPA: PQQ-binding-like beta-propeller repeat protein [Chloroflexota bacterium]|nr:PQQ-binding-like beta-propeller repeat protein [Chloroflexota bacterium]
MRFTYRRLTAAVAAAALMVGPSVTSAQTTPDYRLPPAADWPVVAGNWGNQHFSTLDQINTTNVKNLKGAWMARLNSGIGSKYSQQTTPVVKDGVMYLTTGQQDVFAMNARTGEMVWEYIADINPNAARWRNRGVALGDGKVFAVQTDGRVIALDQQTGKRLWDTPIDADVTPGALRYLAAAPLYFDGVVYTGLSGSEGALRGRLTALDAKTGKELWHWYTIPGPGEYGNDTWAGDSWKTGGGAIWMLPALDPDLGLLYLPVGNAWPDYDGSGRGGDNLFTSSLVALDYKTGQYKWHFQFVHHEIWDYDASNSPVIFDTIIAGQPRKAVAATAKTGWLYLLDRTTGVPLAGVEERPVPQEPRQKTAATQPFPIGDAFSSQCADQIPGFQVGCIFSPFWDVPTVIMPTASGGNDWAALSFSRQTGYFYVTASDQNTAYSVRHEGFDETGKLVTTGGGGTFSPLGSRARGTLTAIDPATNKIVWQRAMPYPIGGGSGSTSTAGGLVFHGEPDGNVQAYDARTGDLLWQFQTGFGADGPVMTYTINGEQYVAIATGGGSNSRANGDGVWAFKLGGSLNPLYPPPAPVTVTALTGSPVNIDRVSVGRLWDPDAKALGPKFEYTFGPQIIKVAVGSTVTWTNDGDIPHTATAQGNSWDTGEIAAGQSVSITMDTAGTYNYSCIPHPWMYGQVIVE